ncbi:MAG: PrsW family glutamic-type intramembrane protease [Phototrophicaceae bacterium]
MAFINNPRLITPPKEEEEVYPYRRAWRSIFIETGTVMGMMLIVFVLVNFIGLGVPPEWRVYSNLLLAISPTILWLLFSRVPENNVIEPRRRLLTIFTVTALVANGIGIPLLNTVFEPDAWLPLQGGTNRILGYMLTVGILQEFLKYLVLRYIVWPDYYRIRIDAVAYGAATATAYTLVISLNYVLANPTAASDVVMMRIFATLSVQMIGSIIVAFGLSETLFSDALSLFLPFMIVLAALLAGVAITLRSSFLNATLGLGVSEQREIFGLLFSVVFYFVVMSIFLFLFNITEQREQDKILGQEI